MNLFVVEIVEDATKAVVKRMGPMPEPLADRCAAGAQINLDHERFSVHVVPLQLPKPSPRPRGRRTP